MKKTFISLACLSVLFAFSISAAEAACTYYVKNGGNNGAAGTSDATAWATISRVNQQSLYAGQTVCFKRGDTWRLPTDEYLDVQSGNSSAYVTYTAYGTGNKPVFLGSVEKNSTSDWYLTGTPNVWATPDYAFSSSVGNLIFDNEQSTGKMEPSTDDLDKQGEYFFDADRDRVFLYSASNPANYYSDIECALGSSMLNMYEGSYINVNNLALRYGASHAIWTGGESHHLQITDNDISYIGGMVQSGGSSGTGGRFGNGIELWESTNDIYVERNRIWEIYDGAMTTQGGTMTVTTAYNHFYRNNIVWNSTMCFEFWNHDASSNVYNIYFENNTCVNSGYGWQRIGRADMGSAIQIYPNEANTWNVFIRNNIFYEGLRGAFWSMSPNDYFGNFVIDYNAWYDSSAPMFSHLCLDQGGAPDHFECDYYSKTKLALWQDDTGKDANSIVANPLFVDELNNDFRPMAGSPVCTASSAGSYVGALPCSTGSDIDSDGIANDGDGSGTPGDNPCTGGQTSNCDDNCMNVSNPDQADSDNDGVGNVCDVNISYTEADLGDGWRRYDLTVNNLTSSNVYTIQLDFGMAAFLDTPVVPAGWSNFEGELHHTGTATYSTIFEAYSINPAYDIPSGGSQSGFSFVVKPETGPFPFRAWLDDHQGTRLLVTGTASAITIGPHRYDVNQDWIIDDFELLDAIDDRDAKLLGEIELLDLIDFWAAGCYEWDNDMQSFKPGCTGGFCQPEYSVKVGSSYYSSLQSAYNYAPNGQIIKAQATTITENLFIDEDKSVRIQGGYDCDYITNNGTTILKGSLTVNGGALEIKDGPLAVNKN